LTALVALVLLRLPPKDPVVATTLLGLFPDSVAVDDPTGRAFVANYLDTTVDVLDLNSGRVLLGQTVGSNGGTHPEAVVVDARDNRVFVATDDGLMSMLDASSGALLRARPVGGSVQTLAVDERRRRLFAADLDSGSVTMLDASTGVILHRSAAGTFPQELGVDDRTDRVFVAASTDDAVTMLDAATGTVLRVVHVGFVPRGMAVSVPLGQVFVAPAAQRRAAAPDRARPPQPGTVLSSGVAGL
jgi:YVTN family beta-propeller protein